MGVVSCSQVGRQPRVVDKSRTFESGSGKAGNLPEGKNGPGMQGGGETLDIRRGPVLHTATIGWLPTCECCDYLPNHVSIDMAGLSPIPATVLDPFCGSGTVGEVCNETGRKFVGLDLSSSYLRELALPRAENKSTSESITELPMFANLQEYPI